MSDKKTAEEIAKTIPCQCSDCGMRESEATQMIQAYADQELASLRKQLEKEQEISQRLSDDLASALDTIEQKEDENRELLDSISQLIYAMNTTGLPWNTDSTAEKAYANCRSLLKKHIG